MIISFGNVSQKMIKQLLNLLKLLTVIRILACSQVLAADYLDSPFSGLLSDRPPAYKDLSPEKLHIWKKLLHYDLNENISQISAESTFFLSPDGHSDPEAEYNATIQFFEKDIHNICFYPARFYLIYGRDIPGEMIQEEGCRIFRDYTDNVGLDKLYIIYVSEDVIIPISANGHIFTKLAGTNAKGKYREYGLTFAASENDMTDLVLKFFSNSIDGIYSIKPYYENAMDYLTNDRSLWEFEINLTEEQKKIFYLHVIELRHRNTLYSFFNINCASGMSKALAVADDRLDSENIVFFETPLEYISEIYRKPGLVSGIEVLPSESENLYFSQNRMSTPVNSPKSIRLEAGGLHSSIYGNGMSLRFAPTLNNIKDDNRFSPALAESKFLEFSGRYLNGKFLLSDLELVNLNPIPDARLGKFSAFSFFAALHNNVDAEHVGLYPELALGNAVSYRMGNFIPYVHAYYGYAVPHSNNHVFVRPEAGIFYWDRTVGKINLSYEIPLTTHQYYRNYMYRYKATWSKSLTNNFSVNAEFTDYKLGHNDSAPRRGYPGRHLTEAGASLVFHF